MCVRSRVASLSQAQITPVVPRNGIHLTLEDVREHAIVEDEIHSCPTRVISLENTLGGMLMPLSEVQRISAFARSHGIRMHCDGARLWEAVAAGGGSLQDFAECFDTVNLCFSKGLGAPVGSIIVGPRDLVKHARWMRKAVGGGLRQSGVVTAAARVAVDTTFGRGPHGEDGLLGDSHKMAKRVEKLWVSFGGRLQHPVHTNMLWLDLASLNCSTQRFIELGAQYGLKLSGNRIITHYQIREEAVRRLSDVFRHIALEKDSAPGTGEPADSAGLYKA